METQVTYLSGISGSLSLNESKLEESNELLHIRDFEEYLIHINSLSIKVFSLLFLLLLSDDLSWPCFPSLL